jgi:AraC family transcriptional regulator
MLNAHGNEKYRPETLIADAAEWTGLRVEVRRIGSGRQNCLRPECTELVHILSGHARVRRRGNGVLQEAMALPGTTWLVPAGTEEDLLELDGSTECLIAFMPDKLLSDSALMDFGVDPARSGLAYAGGVSDEIIKQLCNALHGLVGRAPNPLDAMLVDGINIALAARLIGSYRADGWRPASVQPGSMDIRRLRKVLDVIEARLGDPLHLEDLASEACLSPFHFSRLFTQSMGRPPHAYLTERRVAAAEALLKKGKLSLVEIALEVGLGSQANLTRTFRKITGLTPGQFRGSHRSSWLVGA